MTEERILNPDPLLVKRVLDFKDLDLKVIAGKEGLDRSINRPELNRPALELAGFFEKWKPERVQILGTGEMAFLESRLYDQAVKNNLSRIMAYKPPCVVITNDRQAYPEIQSLAEQHGVTVFSSSHDTTYFTKRLWDHLERELSPRVVRRGVLMDVFNVGVLITGPSSIGKSETALELLTKGHTFVADDLILIRRSQLSELVGTGRSPVPHHMEIRGIGIIDISRMYGPRSVRNVKQVDMVIQLEEWDPQKDYERLGIENRTIPVLGVEIPFYMLPVKPGRNIASIVEVAVLDNKLKENGVFMAKEFDEKLIQTMRRQEGR